MDPNLENPAIFPGIHGPMVTYIRDQHCQPPLSSEDQVWADERLRAAVAESAEP